MNLYVLTDELVVVAIIDMSRGDALASPDHLSVLDEASIEALVDAGEDITFPEDVE